MFSNSSLIAHTNISPNKTINRTSPIDTITIHSVAGNMTIESLGAWFSKPTTQASSNYGIGTDGRIGMYVEEKDRSWCSSSSTNDHRAVTIEVANSVAVEPWPISDGALKSLVNLCADICQRNNIPKLIWRNDKYDPGNLTVHRWFAATSCPNTYIFERLEYIAAEVNKLLTVDGVAEWAREAWNWGSTPDKNGNKLFDGTRPTDLITRQEVITLFYRFKKSMV